MTIAPIKRVTLWVRSADRSLGFYRDLLHLSVLDDKVLEGPYVARLIGLESCRIRMVHLAPAGATHGWLGLYEVTAATPAPREAAAPDPDRIMYGLASIVLEVDDVAARSAALKRAGVRFMLAPMSYDKASPSPGMPAGTYTEAICFDPDGVSVSLISCRTR